MALFQSSKTRWFVIFLVLILGVWSIATLRFQTELLPLFPSELESVQNLQKIKTNFTEENSVLIVGDNTLTPIQSQILATALRNLGKVKSVEELPYGPIPIETQFAFVATQLPKEKFYQFAEALKSNTTSLRLTDTLNQMAGGIEEKALFQLRWDPLQLKEFFPAQSKVMDPFPLLLRVTSKDSLQNFESAQHFWQAIKQTIHKTLPSEAKHIFITGQAAFTAEISKQMRRDMILMLSFTVILVALAFTIFYRSIKPLGWIFLLQGLALLCAFIASRFIFKELNVLSLGFASILLGVGMDYCILVYHHFAQKESHALWPTLRRGIWLSALTTAGAFGVLYSSRFPGLQQLAILVSIGLIAMAFFATEFLSVWLNEKNLKTASWLNRTSEWSAACFSSNRNLFRSLFFFIFLIGIGFFWIKSNSFYDSNIERFQSHNLEAYQGQLFLTSRTSTSTLSYRPELTAQNRIHWSIVNSNTFFSAFEAKGLDQSWSQPTWRIIALLNQWHEGDSTLPSIGESFTAWPQLQRELNQIAIDDFQRLSFAMFLILVTLCAIAHRKMRLIFLNLFALAIALGLFFILLYFSGISMTLVSLLSLPLLIGLTIDYSLHILLTLEKYQGDLKKTYSHLAAPIILTGLSSVIGFTAPLLSQQPALQNFGQVMDFGIVAAVVTGLIALPAFYWRPNLKRPHYSRFLYQSFWFSLAKFSAQILPRFILHHFARFVGTAYALLNPQKVSVVKNNLALVNRNRVSFLKACHVFSKFGVCLADYFYVGSRDPSQALKLIEEKRGYSDLAEAYREKRGALLLTAHLGLFELGGLVMNQLGFPTVVLTFPEPRDDLTQWRANYRKQWQVETVTIGEDPFSSLAVMNHLKAGKFVAALIDRPHPQRSIPVNLLQGQALFSGNILTLALLAKCPVIPVVIVMQPSGLYRIEAFSPIWLEEKGGREETLLYYTQKIADALLPTICHYQTQWFQFVPLSSS